MRLSRTSVRYAEAEEGVSVGEEGICGGLEDRRARSKKQEAKRKGKMTKREMDGRAFHI